MRLYKLCLLGLLLTGVVFLAGLQAGHAARLDDEEAAAKTEAPDSGNKIQLNFRDVEILNVIRLLSELTGKNFLVDSNVRGKVTLIAPEPVSIDEAYEVFLSILEIQGFTVVPQVRPIDHRSFRPPTSRTARFPPLQTRRVPCRRPVATPL